ncbi:MAG: TetR/AcrR family transcriptional regulator [Anaerolineales bacterium]|jgi:AcrR family transcriptional regulator
MPRYKKDQREQVLKQTRQLLLEAAAVEIAQKGYVGANINRISKSAGFAKGTIYNHFSSKRTLMYALIDEVAGAHFDFIVQQVLQEEDPAQRLGRFFEAGFAWVANNLPQGLVMVITLYGPDPDFKQRLGEAYLPMFQFVSQSIIAPGIEQGAFQQVDPNTTANLLMTLYLGTGSQLNESGKHWMDPRQVAAFALNALRRTNASPRKEI